MAETNVGRVETYFKDNPNKTLYLHSLARTLRLAPVQVQNALSLLRAKAKRGEAINIRVVRSGKQWRYEPDQTTPAAEQRTEQLRSSPRRRKPHSAVIARAEREEAQGKPDWAQAEQAHRGLMDNPGQPPDFGSMLEVPATEPPVQFKVLGALVGGGLVLKGESADVNGVWIARRP
jgi:hypothetical protein